MSSVLRYDLAGLEEIRCAQGKRQRLQPATLSRCKIIFSVRSAAFAPSTVGRFVRAAYGVINLSFWACRGSECHDRLPLSQWEMTVVNGRENQPSGQTAASLRRSQTSRRRIPAGPRPQPGSDSQLHGLPPGWSWPGL
jgi:hypothetical protein